jgi:hypothetical protein
MDEFFFLTYVKWEEKIVGRGGAPAVRKISL